MGGWSLANSLCEETSNYIGPTGTKIFVILIDHLLGFPEIYFYHQMIMIENKSTQSVTIQPIQTNRQFNSVAHSFSLNKNGKSINQMK